MELLYLQGAKTGLKWVRSQSKEGDFDESQVGP